MLNENCSYYLISSIYMKKFYFVQLYTNSILNVSVERYFKDLQNGS